MKIELEKFIVESKERIVEQHEEMAKWEAMPPVETMWKEEALQHLPYHPLIRFTVLNYKDVVARGFAYHGDINQCNETVEEANNQWAYTKEIRAIKNMTEDAAFFKSEFPEMTDAEIRLFCDHTLKHNPTGIFRCGKLGKN